MTHVTRVTHMTHDTQVADRPNMCYIFEKVMEQGPQKQCSQVSYISSRDVTSRHVTYVTHVTSVTHLTHDER